MRKPCNNCPFLIGQNYALHPQKVDNILRDIQGDEGFVCHKTVDYSNDWTGEIRLSSRVCFGAALFLEQIQPGGCFSNTTFRLSAMAGDFEPEDLRQDDSVYSSIEDFRLGVTDKKAAN